MEDKKEKPKVDKQALAVQKEIKERQLKNKEKITKHGKDSN